MKLARTNPAHSPPDKLIVMCCFQSMSQIAACTRRFLLKDGLQFWASKLLPTVQSKLTKYNRRQFIQMEMQTREEPEKRQEEERRPEKRKSQKKEDAGAPEGIKVAHSCVVPMFCSSLGALVEIGTLKKCTGMTPNHFSKEKCHPKKCLSRITFGS